MDQPSQQQQKIIGCNLCGKRAQFLCGKCQDVGYCKPQHQKADWPAHKPKCISVKQKQRIHSISKDQQRSQIMEHLADSKFVEASDIAFKHWDQEKKFCQLNPSFQNQLEYGASTMMLIRIWIYFKDFNKALDVLNSYLQVKMPFLRSLDNLPESQDGLQNNPLNITLIQNKLSLICSVASVSHQLVRNAMDILQLLIQHISLIYGPASPQVSTIYFYCGNYLAFLNQPSKSYACFIKCAKLRQVNCSSAYYNAGNVVLATKNYSQALDMMLLALNNIKEDDRRQHPQLQINIYQALAVIYKSLNMFQKTVLSLERALCLREKSKIDSLANSRRYNNILSCLSALRSQSSKIQSQIKLFSLPKQKTTQQKAIQLQLQQYKNLSNPLSEITQTDQQNKDWLQSIHTFKKRLQVDSLIPLVPSLIKQKLFGKNKVQQIRQEELPSVAKSKDKMIQDKVVINLELIEKFTASQMDFLNQLNRLVGQCKEKSAVIQIFQNSNLYQTLNKQKLQIIYRLNPKFVRTNDNSSRNIQHLQINDDQSQNLSLQYPKKETTKKPKIVTPRLNLDSLPKRY